MSHHVEVARIIACKRPFVQRGAVEVDPDAAVAAVPTGIWIAAAGVPSLSGKPAL